MLTLSKEKKRKQQFLNACFHRGNYHFSSHATIVDNRERRFSLFAHTPHIFRDDKNDEKHPYVNNKDYISKSYWYTPTFLLATQDENLLGEFYDYCYENYLHNIASTSEGMWDFVYNLWLKHNNFRLNFLSPQLRTHLLAHVDNVNIYVDDANIMLSLWEQVKAEISVKIASFDMYSIYQDKQELKFLCEHIDFMIANNDYMCLHNVLIANIV